MIEADSKAIWNLPFFVSIPMIYFLILAPFINNVYFCILKQNCK